MCGDSLPSLESPVSCNSPEVPVLHYTISTVILKPEIPSAVQYKSDEQYNTAAESVVGGMSMESEEEELLKCFDL